MASDEAAGWRAGFILNHTFLYDSFEIVDMVAAADAYHTSTNRRKIAQKNQLYFQVVATWAGDVVGADSNRADVRVAAQMDFWMDLGNRPTDDFERNWLTQFASPAGDGEFHRAVDVLIDPNWFTDPTLGDPNGNVNAVLVDPAYTVRSERPGGGPICHAQIGVTLAVESES